MPKLARNGSSSSFGKLTAKIPSINIDDDTNEEALRLARQADMSLSEWVRTLIQVRVHGVDHVARMNEDRLRVVAGIGRETSDGIS